MEGGGAEGREGRRGVGAQRGGRGTVGRGRRGAGAQREGRGADQREGRSGEEAQGRHRSGGGGGGWASSPPLGWARRCPPPPTWRRVPQVTGALGQEPPLPAEDTAPGTGRDGPGPGDKHD